MRIARRQRDLLRNWPLTELHKLRHEINRIFDTREPSGGEEFERWSPSIDVYQDPDKITVQAELPGFKKEDVHVSVHGDTLTITGERRQEHETNGREACRAERFYGRFKREVTLPDSVDAERADASFKEGVLCVYLPKSEHSKRKQIEVKES
jgi:HSP20 family protein